MQKITTYILFIIVLFFVSRTLCWAQQEAIFSQFMFQKAVINPAYSGSAGAPCLSLVHRQQWVGLEGAPMTQALNFHTAAFANRVGLGVTLMNDRIGYGNSFFLNVAYAYRIKLKKGLFSIGVQGTHRQHSVDWAAATPMQQNDSNIGENVQSTPIFNVGMGTYLEAEQFYLGVSIPRFLKKGITEKNRGFPTDFSGETPHWYIMGGSIIELSEKLKFRPAFLLKSLKNAPVNVDMNASIGWLDKIWAGLTYRWNTSKVANFGSAFDVQMQYLINSKLKVGVAYDFTISDLRMENVGTFELLLQYCFIDSATGIRNPRFF